MDRRDTPDPEIARESRSAQIGQPVVDLLAGPNGPRDRQLLFGEAVTVLGQSGEHAYVRANKDGYHGFVAAAAVATGGLPTHRVSAPATHIYAEANIKSPDLLSLSLGSRISAIGETAEFVKTELGHVPKQHLQAADTLETDPVSVALMFLGTPYLWGGNSRWGIDCSGLVQAALLACGLPCPGDSDQQMRNLGPPLATGATFKRGDLLFWKGHVALVRDEVSIIHANAYHMATEIEDLEKALIRTEASGTPLLAHVRP